MHTLSFKGSALPEEIQVSQIVLLYMAEVLTRKGQVQFQERKGQKKYFFVNCDDTWFI